MVRKFDFLVIGSGIAGMSFALKVAHKGKVALICKSGLEEANTYFAQGGVASVTNLLVDNFDKHIEDTMIAGDWISDRGAVEKVVREAPAQIEELIKWGVDFDKNEKGEFDLHREGGHSEFRILHHKDNTGAEIQDSLISVLSDKVLNVPELGDEGFLFAKPGFNVIGTANTRDKGVNEMSSALKRRFNFETVMPVREAAMEKRIIVNEVNKLAEESHISIEADEDVAEILASTYHELREGVSSYGHRIDKPSSVMSTAEAVSVYYQAMITGYYYGDGTLSMDSLVQNLVGAVSKENKDDLEKVKGYFNTVIRDKSSKEGGLWKEYYEARKWLR